MLWWKLDWRSHLGESKTARTCLWKNSVSHPIGPSCRNLSKHCGDHRGARWLLWLSLRCPPAEPPESNLNHSAFGCVAVFACPFLSPPATADVATDLTSLAIIVQLAPGWGCWGREAFHWSVRPPKCAGKQEDAFPQMSSSRDLDLAAFNALDNRRVEVIADGLPLWLGAQWLRPTLAKPTLAILIFRLWPNPTLARKIRPTLANLN